ncbi:MAG: SdrD B-like domain-containing protein [Acidobacteriota bacterium]
MKVLPTLAVFSLLAAPTVAATLFVDGVICTLTDAIVAANTDTAAGGCPAGDPGHDTLILDADVTLSAVDGSSTPHGGVRSGLPDVTDDLTVVAGLGSVIRRDPIFTCDAATGDPVFRFLNLEAGTLELAGLVFEGGCFVDLDSSNQGGGLRAAAGTELTLTQVTVRDHAAFVTGSSLQGGFLHSEGDSVSWVDSRVERVTAEALVSLQGGVIHIDNDVAIDVRDSSFSEVEADGGGSLQGGVIFSQGSLEVDGSTFDDVSWSASVSAQGGAIFSSLGPADIRHSTFRAFGGVGEASASVQGGAVYGTGPRLEVSDTVFEDSLILSGSSCSGGALYSNRPGPYERLIFDDVQCFADGAIEGAAARFLSSDTVLRDCLFSSNGGAAALASTGGAVYAFGFDVVERCAFLGTRLFPGSPSASPEVRGGGLAAGSIRTMRNVTFSGNVIQAGTSTGDGPDAFGAALFLGNAPSPSRLAAITFTNNRAIGGLGGDGFLTGRAFGGALYVEAGHTVELAGSISSGNQTFAGGEDFAVADDCFADGDLSSGGYNVVHSPQPSCDLSAFGDVTDLDPGLYPVADYGCAAPLPDGTCVPSAAVDQTSWAVDWSSCAELGLGDDARGLDRRRDVIGVPNLTADACDAGAFEARDRDGDGVTDVPDLCPDIADPDQSDGDDDGVGDVCDACRGDDASGDTDRDLTCDDSDLCPGSDDGLDADLDGTPDGCDLCLGDDATGDSDGDLVCDDLDLCPGSDDGLDADLDGVPDGCDLCLGDDDAGDVDGDGLCNDLDASVGDFVWLDGGDGVQDGGEPGVAGVTVRLFSAAGALLDTASTDSDGLYLFSPGPGDFYLEFVLPPDRAYAPRDRGADDSVDSDVNEGSGTTSVFTLAAGQALTHIDAGLQPTVIGNRVWNDLDGDGLQSDEETGLADVTVRLLDAGGAHIASTTTDAEGRYSFFGVPSGDYRLEVIAPPGYEFSPADVGGDDHVDSDVDPGTGRGPLFAYRAQTADQAWDAGLRAPPLFADGFESGDFSAWTRSVP